MRGQHSNNPSQKTNLLQWVLRHLSGTPAGQLAERDAATCVQIWRTNLKALKERREQSRARKVSATIWKNDVSAGGEGGQERDTSPE